MNVSPTGIAVNLWTLIREQAMARHWELSDAFFAEIDGFAWVQGWAISRYRTRHTYRDPRFDRVVVCCTCGGDGRGKAAARAAPARATACSTSSSLRPPGRAPEPSRSAGKHSSRPARQEERLSRSARSAAPPPYARDENLDDRP